MNTATRPAPSQPATGCSRVAWLGRLAGLTAIVSLALAACAFPPPTELGTAIVFGASDYNGVSDLPATKSDAEAMHALLSGQGWDSRLFLDAEATAVRLQAELASLSGSPKPVLFYYAGHGFYDAGASIDESCDAYLVPVDAAPLALSLRPKLISSRDLHGWLLEYGIRHPILILDSCHSGGFVADEAAYDGQPADYNPWATITYPSTILPQPAFSQFGRLLDGALQAWLRFEGGSGAVVLAAAGLPELSWEENAASSQPYAGHGIFTYYILQAASDGAADRDGDGYVSTLEAYLYARNQLDSAWNRLHAGSPSRIYLPHQSSGLRDYLLFVQP